MHSADNRVRWHIASPSHTGLFKRQRGRSGEAIRHQPLQDKTTELFALRRLRRRAVEFTPAKMEPWLSRETLLDLPVKGNPTLQPRERAVLQGVGAELVESKAQLLRCGRHDEEIGPIEFYARPNWLDEVGNLTARKIAQAGAAPLLLGDEIMRIA
jgi:hypothetical protein